MLFGSYFGGWEASLKRFVEILKNNEKLTKNNEKSRFGGLEIREKLSLEGKLGRLLTLSWLIRGQVGAKRGKSTLLGGLRGAKLEPKGALEAAKEAPKGPRCATTLFGVGARTLIFEPRASPKVT